MVSKMRKAVGSFCKSFTKPWADISAAASRYDLQTHVNKLKACGALSYSRALAAHVDVRLLVAGLGSVLFQVMAQSTQKKMERYKQSMFSLAFLTGNATQGSVKGRSGACPSANCSQGLTVPKLTITCPTASICPSAHSEQSSINSAWWKKQCGSPALFS